MLHLLPQAPCVLAQGGGWAVDFVGAVERIDEDLNRLLDLIERRVSLEEGAVMSPNCRVARGGPHAALVCESMCGGGH